MNVNSFIGRATKVVSVAMVSLALVAAVPVSADSIFNPGTRVFDDFQTFAYKPAAGSYWNVLHAGLQDSVNTGVRDVPCALLTCAQLMQNGNNDNQGDDQGSFLRETQFAHPDLHNIVLSDVSEMQDDTVSYGGTRIEPGVGIWYPTYGHPVTAEIKARFSANMQPDGSGGAAGTVGLDMFNDVGSLNTNDPYLLSDLETIGFEWLSSDSVISGLWAVDAHDGFPQLIPIRNINMQNWNTFKFVWSISADGQTRTINYYVNGQLIGTTSDTGLASGDVTDTGHLETEIRIDNQHFTFTGLDTIAAPQTNYVDIASINIKH